VKIVVLQGDNRAAHENELLGEFLLTDLPEGPRGSVEIDVRFDISSDGIVSVAARDRSTGREQSIQVTASGRMSDEELKKIMAANEEFAVAEKNVEKFNQLKTEVERVLREIDRLLPSVTEFIGASDFGADALKKIESVKERARRAIQAQDIESLRSVLEPLERAVGMLKGVADRIAKQ
jgi:molecular chaperone DnaK